MVEADAAREPLQDARQVVIRSALQGGAGEIPGVIALPVDVLVLVLDVEQPDAQAAGEPGERQLDDQEARRADRQAHGCEEHHQRKVGQPHRAPLLLAGALARHALRDEEDPQGAKGEHDQRVAEEAVRQALPPGGLHVLVHGQGHDVALAALVQVAGGGVVQGVLVPPVVAGSQHEDTEDGAHHRVGAAVVKVRAVPAIVEGDEQAHLE